MKGKMKNCRKDGGVVPKDDSPKDVYAGASSNVRKEADERKDGGRVKKKEMGKVDGKKSKMRLDRPGRKAGGRVGDAVREHERERRVTDGPETPLG